MTLVASRGRLAAAQMWPVYRAMGHTVRVTFRAMSEATINYTTGAMTTATDETGLEALLVGYSTRVIDGVRVVSGDQQVFLRAADLVAAPTLRDLMLLDGEAWRIVDMRDTASGGIVVMQVRRIGDVDA